MALTLGSGVMRAIAALNVGTAGALWYYTSSTGVMQEVVPTWKAVLTGGIDTAVQVAATNRAAQGVAAAGAVIAVGCGYFFRRRIRTAVKDHVMNLREKLGLKLVEKPALGIDQIQFESVRQNSVEMVLDLPKGQIKVGRVEKDEFLLCGSTIRILDFMVMPAHVMNSAREDGFIYVKGNQGSLRIDVQDFVSLDTDLVARRCIESEFSRVGMPQVSLFERLPDNGDLVSISGVLGKGTVGVLRHDLSSFGKVVYEGTTNNGYSGAPYVKGTQVAGIHCWGGKTNGGYSASYVKVLLQSILHQRPEGADDTSQFLQKCFTNKRFKKNDIRFEPGNDEAYVRYAGQYHIIPGDVFRRCRGFDFLEDVYDNSDSMRVEEALRHSGEEKSLTAPGASGIVEKPGQSVSSQTTELIQMLQGLSNAQHKNIRSLLISSKQGANSSGLIPEQKQK